MRKTLFSSMAESESTETGSMHRSVHEDEYYMAYDRSESAPVARRPPHATSPTSLFSGPNPNDGRFSSPKGSMSQADHHLGGSDSPPGRHKALYDFLPNARSGSVPGEKRVALKKQIPKRIVIEIPVMSHRDDRDSTQNLQPRIIGVYELVRTYDPQGVSGRKAPVWKHCREDLAIQQGDVEGEKGWIIALATSLHNQATPPKVCARVHGAELPHVGTERLQAWDPFKSKWKWCQDVSECWSPQCAGPAALPVPDLLPRHCRFALALSLTLIFS